MKFELERTSDWRVKKQTIRINSLKELMIFVQENGPIIISSEGQYFKELPRIEIYDDWRE